MEATLDVWHIAAGEREAGRPPGAVPGRAARRAASGSSPTSTTSCSIPFMGSGTTAVAAVRTAGTTSAYETDPSYVALAEQRIAEPHATTSPSTGWCTTGASRRPPRSLDHRARGEPRERHAASSRSAAGIVSILSPCVLPMVPGYVSVVTGFIGRRARRGRRRERHDGSRS